MKNKDFKKLPGIIIPIIVAFFNVLIILFPADIITASAEGVKLWFNNVLPSLLPFVIGINILSAMGVVSFLGTLLEPLMKPLFAVPGSGGFALITGMTSGYPMGAKTTAMLRTQNELTQIEAQRLVGFTNNSGPLFILGLIGTTLFNNPQVGYFLIICHYCSAIINGLILKYYKYDGNYKYTKNRNLIKTAFRNMRESVQKDARSFGEILGDSVKNAMETMLVIGGFIILFSVIVKILEVTGIFFLIQKVFSGAFEHFNVDSELFKGFFVAMIEVTNGAKILAMSEFSREQLVFLSGVISFGGFSIHAQALSFIGKTDIKASIYIISKFMHCGLSMVLAQIIYPLFNFSLAETTMVFSEKKILSESYIFSIFMFVFSIIFIIILAFIYNLFKKLEKNRARR